MGGSFSWAAVLAGGEDTWVAVLIGDEVFWVAPFVGGENTWVAVLLLRLRIFGWHFEFVVEDVWAAIALCGGGYSGGNFL